MSVLDRVGRSVVVPGHGLCAGGLALVLGLSACAPLPPQPVTLPLPPRESVAAVSGVRAAHEEMLGLLSYARELRGLSAKPLAEELERQRLLWQTNQAEMQTLSYALVASQPAAGAAQHKRALQLFESLLPAAGERYSDLQLLAASWRQELLERRRLDEQLGHTAQRLREEQRRNEDLERRVQALTEKLAALVAIEQRLLRRNRRPGAQP